MKNLKIIAICYLLCSSFCLFAQESKPKNSKNDGNWSLKQLTLKKTPEAELMIRVGDIDNVNFGFYEDYNPFSGKSTDSHAFPWDIDESDPIGTDRIYVPTSYGLKDMPCSNDGYTRETLRPANTPQPIVIPLQALKKLAVNAISLQFFIDDFQQPTFCSRFQVTLNGKLRLTQMEEMLRYIEQGGPVAKLITIKLTAEQLKLCTDANSKELRILIDDPISGAGDGYAIDFVKLLVNPSGKTEKGMLTGIVFEEETEKPIANATVKIEGQTVKTDAEGKFTIKNLDPGYSIIEGAAKGYARKLQAVDVFWDSKEVNFVMIPLSKEKGLIINGKTLKEGDKLTLKNIQFDRSKSLLLSAGISELDKLLDILKNNPLVEIELLGHTSNEGNVEKNRILSQERADACRKYLIDGGIHQDRIKAIGYGPDKPIADNSSEAGRIQNRRVEILITRMY
jgi:outer membrane protein OmpA-like peptidoglycan-associated protein